MVASCTNTCAQCAAEIEAEQRGIREKIYEPALEKIREWRRGWIRTYAVSTMVAFGGVCFVTLVKSVHSDDCDPTPRPKYLRAS